jgi:hypothetical protein
LGGFWLATLSIPTKLNKPSRNKSDCSAINSSLHCYHRTSFFANTNNYTSTTWISRHNLESATMHRILLQTDRIKCKAIGTYFHRQVILIMYNMWMNRRNKSEKTIACSNNQALSKSQFLVASVIQ